MPASTFAKPIANQTQAEPIKDTDADVQFTLVIVGDLQPAGEFEQNVDPVDPLFISESIGIPSFIGLSPSVQA